MSTNPLPNALPPETNPTITMTTTNPTDSSSPYYASKPPAALTVILSIACGIVATCILLTIVLLLLRHRSSKQAFRQGQQQQHQHTHRASYASNSEPNIKSHADVPVDDGSGSRSAPGADSEGHGVAIYLPVLLHDDSPTSNTKKTTRGDRRSLGLGRALSLPYPKAIYLGSEPSRTDTDTTMVSLPSHIV